MLLIIYSDYFHMTKTIRAENFEIVSNIKSKPWSQISAPGSKVRDSRSSVLDLVLESWVFGSWSIQWLLLSVPKNYYKMRQLLRSVTENCYKVYGFNKMCYEVMTMCGRCHELWQLLQSEK